MLTYGSKGFVRGAFHGSGSVEAEGIRADGVFRPFDGTRRSARVASLVWMVRFVEELGKETTRDEEKVKLTDSTRCQGIATS